MAIEEKLIDAFCGKDDIRDYLQRPGNWAGKTILSNGHIALVLDDCDASLPEVLPFSSVVEKYMNLKPGDWFDIQPVIDIPQCGYCNGTLVAECGECDGSGSVFWHTPYNCYEATCQRCEGETKAECEDCIDGKAKTSIDFNGTIVDYTYIARFKAHFENVYFSVANSPRPTVLVKHAKGGGAIMGRSRPHNNHQKAQLVAQS